MSAITNFWDYILGALPTFLMSEPIVYFVGLWLLMVIIGVVRMIINLR